MEKNKFNLQILVWLLTTAVALTAYSFNNFVTKETLKESFANHIVGDGIIMSIVEKRLERIENKLDNLIQTKE